MQKTLSRGEMIAQQIKREHEAEGRRRRKKQKETLEALARLTYPERVKMLRKLGVRYR